MDCNESEAKKDYATKKVKRIINGFKMRSGRMPTGTMLKIGPDLPDKHNPVIVRVVTRSELTAIPRDRYEVRVIKVMVPLLDTTSPRPSSVSSLLSNAPRCRYQIPLSASASALKPARTCLRISKTV